MASDSSRLRAPNASLMDEWRVRRESVRVFFEPKSVAVVGASRKPHSIGGALVDNLKDHGFKGPIYPINPNAAEIAGLRAYPALSAIGAPIDLVIIAIPAAGVEQVVREAGRLGARGVCVISAGFAEASAEGRATERRIRDYVRSAGMRLVGPNSMGVLNANLDVMLDGTFAPPWPPSGNVSMLSQSGALGIAMLDHVRALNLGLAGFISIGNKADVSSNDLLAYWVDDPDTQVIVLYLESFGNPRNFARLAPEVARKKPIVAVKSGRSAAGTRAASSHSASLASLDVGIDALFAQAGVIRTNTFEELFDVVALLATQPPLRGPRIGVVTNAGGPGILLADACGANGLDLPDLGKDTVARLRAYLPAAASTANPVDLLASGSAEHYARAIELVGNDPGIDAVVVIYVPPLVTEPEEVAAAISDAAARLPAHKPIAAVFLSSKGAPELLSRGKRGQIPSYSFPENAAQALSSALRYSRFRERPRGKYVGLSSDERRDLRAVIDRALERAKGEKIWLEPEAVSAALAACNIAVAPARTAPADPKRAAEQSVGLGYPVVLKAIATKLVHKSDIGGVTLHLESAASVERAATEMRTRVGAAGYALEGFLIQREIEGGVEAFVGMTSDPSLGPLLLTGLGGVNVELMRDVAFRLVPVSDVDAEEMLAQLKTAKLLDGYRGSKPADRAALLALIQKLSALIEAAPELVEFDLNPVKVLAPGEGVVVVDGRIRLAPVAAKQPFEQE